MQRVIRLKMYYRGLAQAADTDVLPIKSVAGVGWGGGGGEVRRF